MRFLTLSFNQNKLCLVPFHFDIRVLICSALLQAKSCISTWSTLKILGIINIFWLLGNFFLSFFWVSLGKAPGCHDQIHRRCRLWWGVFFFFFENTVLWRGSLREYLYCGKSHTAGFHCDCSFSTAHSNLVSPRLYNMPLFRIVEWPLMGICWEWVCLPEGKSA